MFWLEYEGKSELTPDYYEWYLFVILEVGLKCGLMLLMQMSPSFSAKCPFCITTSFQGNDEKIPGSPDVQKNPKTKETGFKIKMLFFL